MAWRPEAGKHIEVRFYCWHAASSQIGINTVRFEIRVATDPGLILESRDLCGEISNEAAPLYKALLDSSAKYAGCSMQDFPGRQTIADWSKNGAGNGTVVGTDVPTQASGLLSLRTNLAKRSGRGRLYIPFPSIASCDADSLPNTAYVEALDDLGSWIQGPLALSVGPDNIPVVLYGEIVNVPKKRKIDDPPTPPQVFKVIEKTFGVKKWATQRRRGSYGRKNDLPAELT